MKRHWKSLLLLLILVGLGAWVARHTYWDYETRDQPMRGDALTNPFYTFERLAQRLGVHTRQIADLKTLPAPDAVLMISDLQAASLRDGLSAVQSWVESGGRLLVSRNLLLTSPTLQSWSGVALALHQPAQSADRADAGKARAGAAAAGAGATESCPELTERVGGTDTGRRYRACIGSTEFSLNSKRSPIWLLANEYGTQMLRVGIGKGSLAVIVCECVVENKSLLHDDHARLVFAAVPLRGADRVSILNPRNTDRLPLLIWRSAAAAVICAMLALGLAIWRNLPRFGALVPMQPPLRRSLAEQLRARARLAWRTRKLMTLHQAQRTALDRVARRQLPAYDGLDSAQRIGALSSQSGIGAAALSAALAYDFHGSAGAELAAIELLETARRALQSRQKLSHGGLP